MATSGRLEYERKIKVVFKLSPGTSQLLIKKIGAKMGPNLEERTN